MVTCCSCFDVLYVHVQCIVLCLIRRRNVLWLQLALKHRQNKNQKMRIISFIGSPVEAETKEVCMYM